MKRLLLSDRIACKQSARDEDDRAFASGEKSAAQLNRENGPFGSRKAHVDFKSAKKEW